MPAIIHPVGNCLLYSSGVDSFLNPTRQGFAYTDFLNISFPVYQKKGQVYQDPFHPNVSPISIIREIGKVVLTPLFNPAIWDIDSHWKVIRGQWASNDQLVNMGSRLIMSGPGGGEDPGGEIESTFQCPESGGWQVVIRRTTPKASDSQSYSYIKWDKFLLIIPYTSSIGLFKEVTIVDDNDIEFTFYVRVGDPYLPDNAGASEKEGMAPFTVSYRNMDGKILLSGDGGTTNWVYEETDPILVPAHKITLGHVTGPCEFEFRPMRLPVEIQQGFFTTGIPVYYRTAAVGNVSGSLLATLEFEINKYLPPGTDVSVEYDDDKSTDTQDETTIVYKCLMSGSTPAAIVDDPALYGAEAGDEVAGFFDLTPELESVMVKHKPQLLTSAIPWIDLAHPVNGERLITVTGEEAIDFDTSTWTVILDNEDGALSDPTNNKWLKPYKAMQVWGGFKYEDGTESRIPMFTGVVTTPVFSSGADRKHRAQVRIANMSWLCQQVFNKGDWPMFDGWRIRDALEWLAFKCRIAQGRQLFTGSGEGFAAIGVNQTLSRGTVDQPLWYANILETSAWEMMKKMADYIKYDLYFDRIGNLVCKPKPLIWDGTFQHRFYANYRDVSDILNYNQATDVELSYQGEDWYNAVYVGGYHRGGGVISTYKANLSSIYDPLDPHYIGFEKAVAIAYEAFVDIGKIQEITDIVYAQSLLFPRRISFTTWFNPILEAGQVFEFTGSRHVVMGTDASPKYYRIMNLSHTLSIATISLTQVVGELVGPIDSP